MLRQLLSTDALVLASTLVWVMTLPTMLRLRVLNKVFYDFIMHEPSLWYKRVVELWHYRVPKSWWVCLLRLFQHTSQLVLNSKQLGYAVDIQVPQLLLWSRFEPLEYVTEGPQGEVVRYPRYLQIYSHVRRYPFDSFVLPDNIPPVVPVQFDIQFLGVLDKIYIGFTSFILFSELEASLPGRAHVLHSLLSQRGCHDNPGRTIAIHCASGRDLLYRDVPAWYLNGNVGVGHSDRNQNPFNFRSYIQYGSHQKRFRLGLSWLPEGIALYFNREVVDYYAFAAHEQLVPHERLRFFMTFRFRNGGSFRVRPLVAEIVPGDIGHSCDVCQYENAVISCNRCRCGNFYCFQHGISCKCCSLKICQWCVCGDSCLWCRHESSSECSSSPELDGLARGR
jgi:hypothetical protein